MTWLLMRCSTRFANRLCRMPMALQRLMSPSIRSARSTAKRCTRIPSPRRCLMHWSATWRSIGWSWRNLRIFGRCQPSLLLTNRRSLPGPWVWRSSRSFCLTITPPRSLRRLVRVLMLMWRPVGARRRPPIGVGSTKPMLYLRHVSSLAINTPKNVRGSAKAISRPRWNGPLPKTRWRRKVSMSKQRPRHRAGCPMGWHSWMLSVKKASSPKPGLIVRLAPQLITHKRRAMARTPTLRPTNSPPS